MTPGQLSFLAAAIFVVAFLYSCVGHARASGYIAVMSLFSLAPAVIKPTALTLTFLWPASAPGSFSARGIFRGARSGRSLHWPFRWPCWRLYQPADPPLSSACWHGLAFFGRAFALAAARRFAAGGAFPTCGPLPRRWTGIVIRSHRDRRRHFPYPVTAVQALGTRQERRGSISPICSGQLCLGAAWQPKQHEAFSVFLRSSWSLPLSLAARVVPISVVGASITPPSNASLPSSS